MDPKQDPSNILNNTLSATTLTVHIRSPEQVFFDGPAKAVSSVNERGPFDVLPQHENFISVVKDKLVVTMPDNHKKDIPMKSGVIKVDQNKVQVFLGIEALREE